MQGLLQTQAFPIGLDMCETAISLLEIGQEEMRHLWQYSLLAFFGRDQKIDDLLKDKKRYLNERVMQIELETVD